MRKIVLEDPKILKLHPGFSKQFHIETETVDSLQKSMEKRGFDDSFPLLVWEETGFLVDGHTRRLAAIRAGLARVPVEYRSFASEAAVTDFMNRIQFHRRATSKTDKIRMIAQNKEFKKARNKKKFIADLLQCSDASAGRYLAILANPAKMAEIMGADVTETKERTRKKRPELTENEVLWGRIAKIIEFLQSIDFSILSDFQRVEFAKFFNIARFTHKKG